MASVDSVDLDRKCVKVWHYGQCAKCGWCGLPGEAERSVVECGGVDGVSSEGVEKVGVDVSVGSSPWSFSD